MKPTRDPNEAVLDADIDNLLLQAQTPIEPAPERAAAMRARLLAKVRAERSEPKTDLFTIHADEGEWVTVAPKMEIKMLREFADSFTCLVRLHPGGVIPPHQHLLEEECVVLEGEVQLGDIVGRPGDYHVAPRGVPHPAVYSTKGALLFLRGVTRAETAPA